MKAIITFKMRQQLKRKKKEKRSLMPKKINLHALMFFSKAWNMTLLNAIYQTSVFSAK